MRAVVEAAGIKDILSKSLGSPNPVNVVQAALMALTNLRDPQEVVQMRRRVTPAPAPAPARAAPAAEAPVSEALVSEAAEAPSPAPTAEIVTPEEPASPAPEAPAEAPMATEETTGG